MKNISKYFFLQLCICILFSLFAAGCSRKEQETGVKPLSSGNEVVAATALLATIADGENAPGADSSSAHKTDNAVQNQSAIFQVRFNDLGRGVVYIAERSGKSYVVYNGKAGRPYISIGKVVISPDGGRVAYGARINDKWRIVESNIEGRLFDGVDEPVFSLDSKHVAYEAKSGEKWHIVLDNKMNDGCLQYYQKPVFSSNASYLFLIENTETDGLFRLVVSDLSFKKLSVKELRVTGTVISKDRSRIATASQEDGKYKVIEFSFEEPDKVKKGAPYDAVSNIVFSDDGASLAYIAQREGARFLVFNDKEELLPEGGMLEQPIIRPDQKGVGVILADKKGFFLHQAFYRDGENARRYVEAGGLVYSSKNNLHAYIAAKEKTVHIVINGKEGPAFDRIVTPVFSPDGRLLVYRARKDGKRFVVVSDENGKTIRQHPAYEMVFDTVFTDDGKSVAYGVKAGRQLIWKVERLP